MDFDDENECCGLKLLQGFYFEGDGVELFKTLSNSAMTAYNGGFRDTQFENLRMQVLISVTDDQINNRPRVFKYLKEIGYTVVSRYENPNSGNHVNFLMRDFGSETTEQSPFNEL